MRINNLKINSFGKLEDKYLEFKKFNLIYGDNEAGKSTLLNYIMNIFYGMSKNKNYKNSFDYDRFLPWNNSDFSGQINYSLDNGANYRAYRDFCKRETYVYDENNTEISNLFSVDKKLGNQFLLDQIKLDRELIEKTFVINQNSLKILKNDREDLIQKISNLIESGSEEISYEKMQKKLGNLQLENVGSDRSSDRPYNIAKDNFERSNDEINYLKSINDDKYLINKKLNDIDEKIDNIKDNCSNVINTFFTEYLKSKNELPPTAIIITKYDICKDDTDAEELCEIIKEAFSPFFVKNNTKKIVTIIPVSIGINIMENDGSGKVKPLNIHLPIFMGIWFALSKKIQDYVKKIQKCKQENKDYIDWLKARKYKEEDRWFFKDRDEIERLAGLITDQEKNNEQNNIQMNYLLNAMANNSDKLIKELEKIPYVYIDGDKSSFSDII